MLTQLDRWNLMAMHEYRRPHGSTSEKKFIDRFIRPLRVTEDSFGNLYKIIPEPGTDKPRILWSAHTDTVHTVGGRQMVSYRNGYIKLAVGSTSNCLGADNGAGVWMLTQMIQARIPGLYVFHRQEESGGRGAEYFLKNSKTLLEGIQAAVAFDRCGTKSIITHQRSSRSCSDAFAISLADGLAMGHKPDPGGAFTDTEVYRELISECSNVSVGYENAHWKAEYLDLFYLGRLRDAVLRLDTSTLVIERDPSVIELPWWVQQRMDRAANTEAWRGRPGVTNGHGDLVPYRAPPPIREHDGSWTKETRLVTIVDFLKAYPEESADYLESLGVNAADLRDHLDAAGALRLDRLFESNMAGAE